MPDIAARKLGRLREELAFLRAHAQVPLAQWAGDGMLRRSVERALQTAIEACIDLGRHLVLVACWGEPATGREVAGALMAHGVLTEAQARLLGEMIGFRNILVHEYDVVDETAVWAVLTRHLDDLCAIGAALARGLSAAAPADGAG